MSQLTLNDLVAAAVTGAEQAEEAATSRVEVVKEASAAPASTDDVDGAEKLASVLEYLGRRGIENFVKEASEASAPPRRPVHKANGLRLHPHQRGRQAWWRGQRGHHRSREG
jgi:hypothetical protein